MGTDVHAGKLVDPVVCCWRGVVGGEVWCDGLIHEGGVGRDEAGELEAVVRHEAGYPVEGGFHVCILLEAGKGLVGASAAYLRSEALFKAESVLVHIKSAVCWRSQTAGPPLLPPTMRSWWRDRSRSAWLRRFLAPLDGPQRESAIARVRERGDV